MDSAASLGIRIVSICGVGHSPFVNQNIDVGEKLNFTAATEIRRGRPQCRVLDSIHSTRHYSLQVVSVHRGVHFAIRKKWASLADDRHYFIFVCVSTSSCSNEPGCWSPLQIALRHGRILPWRHKVIRPNFDRAPELAMSRNSSRRTSIWWAIFFKKFQITVSEGWFHPGPFLLSR